MMIKKPKVLVVANNKGGVGKSLICQLIATYLSYKKGLKVLAFDFDPQGNMSYRFLSDTRVRDMSNYKPPIHPEYSADDPDCDDWIGRSSALDMWTEQPVIPYPTTLENLEILPSDASLIKAIENFEYSESLDEIVQRTYDFLNCDDFLECGYDVVIIDTPPAKGPLTQAAIRSATDVLIPIELSNKSLQGLAGMIDLIRRQNAYRPSDSKTKIAGLLMNKVDYNKRGPQNRIIDTIEATPQLKEILLKDIVLHDSPRAIDIDEDKAPLTAPYTELSPSDRFAIEAKDLGEYMYRVLGFGNSNIHTEERAHDSEKEMEACL